MKTIFIINPKAGKGKVINKLIKKIRTTADKLQADYNIYTTKCPGDATVFVSEYCKKYGLARFIACGGDGTLSEVVNGAISFENTQIGVMPIGTGNDFCRNFEQNLDFSDVENTIQGKTVKCDAIKYITKNDNITKSGYCINMANIGFDCNVADLTSTVKKKTIASGSMAYLISILISMIKKKGANLLIETDNKLAYRGRLLLTSIANGCFCGGGIKSNPFANLSDGMMNVNIIKNIKRRQFVYLLPHYMKGTIFRLKNINKYLINTDCKKILIKPLSKNMRMCIDGEIMSAGDTEFKIVHNAFNFVLPEIIHTENMFAKMPNFEYAEKI